MARRSAFVATLAVALSALGPTAIASDSDESLLSQAFAYVLPEAVEVPLDPSNLLQGNPRAAALGRELFYDPKLSATGQISCASCHVTAGKIVPNENEPAGLARKFRTTMPVAGAAHQSSFFWDGRKDSLWSQALAPLENRDEHAITRSEVASYVLEAYGDELALTAGVTLQAFRPDLAKLPQASPLGTRAQRRAWSALNSGEQRQVNELFVLTGKLIAAFEATLAPPRGNWDRIISAMSEKPGSPSELSPSAKRGFLLFNGRARCGTCHSGPLFSDGDFHNTGLSERSNRPPDMGRQAVLMSLLQDEFNCLGPWSDAGPDQCPDLQYISLSMERALGAFRTPSLRGVSERQQYMHSGQFKTLAEVINHYNVAPPGPHGRLIGTNTVSELVPLGLSARDKADLITFLGLL
jgi:cytochrome c peroxidase